MANSDWPPFLFSSLLGEMIQFDEHISQMGWFNHQLVMICPDMEISLKKPCHIGDPHVRSQGWDFSCTTLGCLKTQKNPGNWWVIFHNQLEGASAPPPTVGYGGGGGGYSYGGGAGSGDESHVFSLPGSNLSRSSCFNRRWRYFLLCIRFLCSNPFCKWFFSGFGVPKHLLNGVLIYTIYPP